MAEAGAIYCQAEINYSAGEFDVQPVSVAIHDGRQRHDLDWQSWGFELVSHQSAVTDWADEAAVAATYYPEMEAVAKQLTGCDHALIAGHIHRNPEAAAKHADFAPIQYAHSDFTASYGDLIRQRYVQSEPMAKQALKRAGVENNVVRDARRILVLQFWRNVGPEAMDLPLAFCDARSVPEGDLKLYHVPEYGGEAVPFDTFGLRQPQAENGHDWYVFPQMRADEAVAFRTYDSELAEQGGRFWTPHCAFVDPVVEGAEPRASIEVRATCLFE